MGLSKLPSGAPPGSRSRFPVLDGLSQTRHFSIQFLMKSFILEPPASKCSFEASGPLPEEAAWSQLLCILCGQSRRRCPHSAALWPISMHFMRAKSMSMSSLCGRLGIFLFRPPPWPTKVRPSGCLYAYFLAFMRIFGSVGVVSGSSRACVLYTSPRPRD